MIQHGGKKTSAPGLEMDEKNQVRSKSQDARAGLSTHFTGEVSEQVNANFSHCCNKSPAIISGNSVSPWLG